MARPKKDVTKCERFEMRATPEQYEMLSRCAVALGKSKADTIIAALEMLDRKLKRTKK